MFDASGAVRTPVAEMRHWLPFFLRLAGASRPARFRAGTAALTSCMTLAAPAWRRLLQEIGEPQLLIERGHLVVWESLRSAKAGKARWRETATGPATFDDARAEDVERLEALTRRKIYGAIRFEGTGQFTDPGTLLERLEHSIVGAGASRVNGLVSRIGRGPGGGAFLETADGMKQEADAIVIAAGVASGKLLGPAGLFAPLIAERGYHIQAPTDAWPDGMPPIVFEDRSLIVTNFTSGLRASGFVEFGRADRPANEALWSALKSHVDDLGLPFGRPVARWMGSRPTLPDYLPAIGRSPSAHNLYYAFGHQHLGLTLAAVTADLVAELVLGQAPAVDLRPFDLARFGG